MTQKYIIKPGKNVVISCEEFQLQRRNKKGVCLDSLEIQEEGSSTIITFCGNELLYSNEIIKTTASVITLTFKSDATKHKKGFSCKYETLTTHLSEALDAHEKKQCLPASTASCSCTSATKSDSYYVDILIPDGRLIVTSGIPNHEFEDNSKAKHSACQNRMYMVIPAKPEQGTTFTNTPMGPTGIATSGGYFYNHLSDITGTVAVVNEVLSFDSCNGHSDGKCRYHYHQIPKCLMTSQKCVHLGYMRDGFPVKSYCTKNKKSNKILKSCYKRTGNGDGSHESHYVFSEENYKSGACDLDEANGYKFKSGYVYLFTEDYPFIPSKYLGKKVKNICGF